MKRYNITVNGKTYDVAVEEAENDSASAVSSTVPVQTVSTPASSAPVAEGTKVSAPMPGTILDIKVSVGDMVSEGAPLFVLEAMKMENDVNAPCSGKVVSINATKGSAVETGTVLAVIN